MFKKLLSLALVFVLVLSVAVVAASAAQVEIADGNADAPAEVAAADGDSAETGANQVLNFNTESAGWKNFKKVFCHIWAYNDESFDSWQSKAEAATDTDGDKIWTYDITKKGFTIKSGVTYCCIFSNDNGMQTYNLLFDSSVLGDTAYCDGTEYENPTDSTKTAQAAFWEGQDKSKFGPELKITSIGNLVGTCLPSSTSYQAMFETFLIDTLANARTYSGKNDQDLLDSIAKLLNLKQDNVTEAIKATEVTVEWSAAKSSLPTGKNEDANKKPDGSTTTPGGGSSTGGGSTTTGGSSKTGSGTNSKTGQGTTALFIMLGVMVAAAGVILVVRRKDRA